LKPIAKHITIHDNEKRIKFLIKELVLNPRLNALKWSKITDQTPNMKIGYPGQHLASLVVGMKGKKTGARGNDIVDGSEVKSCSRVDASDKCNYCDEKLLRTETVCPACDSKDIKRDNTSKWLFTIRSVKDLNLLTTTVKRIVLVLADYPNFDKQNFNVIRFQVFEIWTNSQRCSAFKAVMTDYYKNVYLSHKKKTPNKTPAPQNFWPYSFQFYNSSPIKIFSCIVSGANSKPVVEIKHYIKPSVDRNTLQSELMPTTLLNKKEFSHLMNKVSQKSIKGNLADPKTYNEFVALVKRKSTSMKKFATLMPTLNEEIRKALPIRKAKPFTIKTKYVRR
jgi:hypothetical protein